MPKDAPEDCVTCSSYRRLTDQAAQLILRQRGRAELLPEANRLPFLARGRLSTVPLTDREKERQGRWPMEAASAAALHERARRRDQLLWFQLRNAIAAAPQA